MGPRAFIPSGGTRLKILPYYPGIQSLLPAAKQNHPFPTTPMQRSPAAAFAVAANPFYPPPAPRKPHSKGQAPSSLPHPLLQCPQPPVFEFKIQIFPHTTSTCVQIHASPQTFDQSKASISAHKTSRPISRRVAVRVVLMPNLFIYYKEYKGDYDPEGDPGPTRPAKFRSTRLKVPRLGF